MDIAAKLTELLSGRRLLTVKKREADWAFGFEVPGSGLRSDSIWRVIAESQIALTSEDDGQKFGLTAPLNGEQEAIRLLGGKLVERISIRSDTGDISVHFSQGIILEVLNTSRGYESWEIGVADLRVIGMGGGKLTIFSKP